MNTNIVNNIDLTNYIMSLSYSDFQKLVDSYSIKNNVSFDVELKNMVSVSLQSKLDSLGVNKNCPKCESSIKVKDGIRANGIQAYKCKSCNTKFTSFTNTIFEKSRFHWEIWVKMLEMTLNNLSIENMTNILRNDYDLKDINTKTVWSLRLKLIHAIASLPKPKLTGTIQIDETFVRESQKGSRNLKSYIQGEERIARYGRVSSKYGVMGSEFATITTAIDSKGYSVCIVSGLGKLTSEMFTDLFDEYIESPSYICTDGNSAYNDYCNLNNIPHYIKLSNYNKILEDSDYYNTNRNENKQKILNQLYNANLIDRIENKGNLSYIEFNEIKSQYKLSLSKVNELHNDIKKFIYGKMVNVSTKYLQDYIGYFNYIKNYKVRYGRFPNTKIDIEQILTEILTLKVNYTNTDLQNKELELPIPTGRYIAMLKENTDYLRKISTDKYFKFNEEDGVKSFNYREILFNLPKYKFENLCKKYKIPKYKKISKWSAITLLLKKRDIKDKIMLLIAEDRILKDISE